jgi:hypothetical protein
MCVVLHCVVSSIARPQQKRWELLILTVIVPADLRVFLAHPL